MTPGLFLPSAGPCSASTPVPLLTLAAPRPVLPCLLLSQRCPPVAVLPLCFWALRIEALLEDRDNFQSANEVLNIILVVLPKQ